MSFRPTGVSIPSDFCILVAEDDAATRLSIVLSLRRFGYEVLEAGDGVEALQLAREPAAKPIALLISDFNMPRMNGAELIHDLKHSQPDLPVIILTGSHPDAVPADLASRVNSVIRKPAFHYDLIQHVNALLLR